MAYDRDIKDRFDVAGREVLIFSPSVSELRFLNARGLAGKVSADIRPDSKPDLQIDMCAMPEVADGSKDFVFASYLMPVVYDKERALDEVRRILAPGGAFISVEPLQKTGSGREITDVATQAAWYGADALRKYKIGSFRLLGRDAFYADLGKRFDVDRIDSVDPITEQTNTIHVCRAPTRI